MSFKNLLNKRRESTNEATDTKALSDKVFLRSALLSGLAILICVVALASSSFAWFKGSVQTTQTIQAAVYKLDITASPVENTSPAITESQNAAGNTLYTLSSGAEYSVTATAVADETTSASTGYIKLVINGETYYTVQIDRGETISFTLSFDTETTIEVIECWGTSSLSDADRHIINGGSYHNMQ